jgi:gas vesicle protein
MYDDYRGGGGVLAAFILGGIIGAALGLLFAPRPGKETRDFLVEKGGAYVDQGKELYDSGRERVTQAYEAGKDKVSHAYVAGRDTASEKSEELKAKIDTVRSKLREQVGQTTSTVKEKVVENVDEAHSVVSKAADAMKSGLSAVEKAGHGVVDAVAEKASSGSIPPDGSGAAPA